MIDVLHLTSAHPYQSTRIYEKMCCSSVSHGLATQLAYVDTYSGPIEHSELPEGIKLCRLPHTASKFRILNKVKRAFVAGGFGSKTKAKIIHYHDPELTLFAPLWRLQGKSVIFDSHEDFVGEIQAKNLNRFFKFLFQFLLGHFV